MIGMSPGRGGPGLLQQQHSTPPRSGAPFASPPPAWPTCVRIEAAPEDVSSADVFDFFDGLSITSNGVHIHQIPGGTSTIHVEFNHSKDCDAAAAIKRKLNGASVIDASIQSANDRWHQLFAP